MPSTSESEQSTSDKEPTSSTSSNRPIQQSIQSPVSIIIGFYGLWHYMVNALVDLSFYTIRVCQQFEMVAVVKGLCIQSE